MSETILQSRGLRKDSSATLEVLRLFDSLRSVGQTLVIVTHDSRIAATADRLISMRDGGVHGRDQAVGGDPGQPRRPDRAGGLKARFRYEPSASGSSCAISQI